ncbi:MAG: type II toxin-antitoxin system PemK/MazF family toxin [Chloroflexi bacterium]|nr:type II toxin-antitoxin system PemK/MazF family toxin [Chloroflexota bacterium]MCL5273329.1 type II toxin-antitoxin system PemK/MazF family toxin [Chloroflexota bacterium]
MARILRGDIWWADLNPVRGHEQAGIGPVLIISHDVFNDRSGTVIAVAITSQEPAAGFPLTLEIHSAKLPRRSWVKISQIRTLSAERLAARAGQVPLEELDQVIDGLNEIVGN